MSEAELLEREQRRKASQGMSCQAPKDPAHALGSVKTMLVDLPGDVNWLDDGLKQQFDDYIGGISVINTIREERALAEKPYSRWAIGTSVHVVRFNSVLELGDVAEVAKRLAERQVDKEGRPLSTEILAASRGTLGVAAADTIEYRVKGAAGPVHFMSLTCVLDGRLYNVTAQAPEQLWPEVGQRTRDSLASANLCSKVSKFFAGYASG